MNNKLIGAIGFIAGAAVGSVITWKLVETKYRKLAEEEIASVNALYSGKDTDEEYVPLTDEDYFVKEEDLTEEDYSDYVKEYIEFNLKQIKMYDFLLENADTSK